MHHPVAAFGVDNEVASPGLSFLDAFEVRLVKVLRLFGWIPVAFQDGFAQYFLRGGLDHVQKGLITHQQPPFQVTEMNRVRHQFDHLMQHFQTPESLGVDIFLRGLGLLGLANDQALGAGNIDHLDERGGLEFLHQPRLVGAHGFFADQ
ncbi:hypothetical protein D3C81_1379790 [compost metagenome]